MNIISALNNREIAAAIWLLILLLWIISIRSVRQSLSGLLKTFFSKQIIIPSTIMLVYVFLMVLLFEKIGIWDRSAIKDTILWTIGPAFVTFFDLSKVSEDKGYFKKAILDNLKLVLLLEFIVNLYSFNLIIELAIVPIVSFVVLMSMVAGLKPENKSVKVFFDYVLVLFGLVLIVFTFREQAADFQNFATRKNLRDFFLPLLFSIAFLPFVYLMALYSEYEKLFNRTDFANDNSDLAKYAKRKILATCHVNLSKLNKLSRKVGFPRVSSKDDVLALIKKAED